MAPLPQLLLAARKALVAKVELFELVRARALKEDLARVVEELIRFIGDDKNIQGDDTQSLEDYLAGLAPRARQFAEAISPDLPALTRLLDDYSEALRGFGCCGADDDRCAGGTSDWVTVAARGTTPGGCLSFLSDPFDGVARLADATYAGAAPSGSPRRVRLASAVGPRDRALGAESDARDAETLITVKISAAIFDMTDCDALPYVLFHECLVHAQEAMTPTAGAARRLDAFSEGWMDRVAYEVLLDHLHRPDRAVWDVAPLVAVHVRSATESYHERRYHSEDGLQSRFWRRGQQASMLLAAVAEDALTDGREVARRLALEINRAVGDIAARNALVEFVLDAHRPDSGLRNRLMLERIVRQFASGRLAADALVERVARFDRRAS